MFPIGQREAPFGLPSGSLYDSQTAFVTEADCKLVAGNPEALFEPPSASLYDAQRLELRAA